MSSILDALNKLEREQAQAEQDSADDVEVSAEVARQDLVGESLWHDRMTVRLSPGVLAIGLAVFALVLVAVSVLVSFMLLGRGSTGPEVAASQPVEVTPAAEPPLPSASTDSSTQEALAVEKEEAAVDHRIEPAGSPSQNANPTEALQVAAVPTPTPASPTAADPAIPSQPGASARLTRTQTVREPLPVRAVPEQPPAVTQESEPDRVARTPARTTPNPEAAIPPAATKAPRPEVAIAQPATKAPAPSTTRPPEVSPTRGLRRPATSLAAVRRPARMTRPQEPAEEPPRPRSIRSLPVLSPGVQSRYGIENLKVNMVGPVTETNPYGWALINRRKVQEGETIQGTRARLVQVEPYGIAIEITSTGERYFRAF